MRESVLVDAIELARRRLVELPRSRATEGLHDLVVRYEEIVRSWTVDVERRAEERRALTDKILALHSAIEACHEAANLWRSTPRDLIPRSTAPRPYGSRGDLGSTRWASALRERRPMNTQTKNTDGTDSDAEARADWEGMGQTAFTTHQRAPSPPTSWLNRAVAKVRDLPSKLAGRLRTRHLD